MIVYGADFSGGKDVSKGIYYAQGILSGNNFLIEEVRHCEDRLDLFAVIISSVAPWGLDFPFAIPQEVYTLLGISNWPELLNLAILQSRSEFLKLLEAKVPSIEISSKQKTKLCRFTDVEAQTFSPLKKYNPNLRSMLYGGLKLLAYLKQHGASIYPFDELDSKRPRIYEIYPSQLWRKTNLRRTTYLERFVQSFNSLNIFKLQIPDYFLQAPNQDFADAIVVCICMAAIIKQFNIDKNWTESLKNLTDNEWSYRQFEGIIVRA